MAAQHKSELSPTGEKVFRPRCQSVLLPCIVALMGVLCTNTIAADEEPAGGDKIFLKNGRVHYGKIKELSTFDVRTSWGFGPWEELSEDEAKKAAASVVEIHSTSDGIRYGSSWLEKKSNIVKVEKRYREPTGLALKAEDENWGKEDNGYQTQLMPVGKEYRVGQRMEFALLLKNAGERVRWYDAQGLSHNTISVKDSAGKEVYCKIGSHQTGGSESPLDKGETDVLFSKRDLAADYVIAKPGTYTVQFRGGSYGMGGKDSELPPSNVVKMEVKGGKPLVFDTILLKLEGVVPSERWQVSGYHDHRTAVDTKFIVSRSPESRLKRDVLRAEVWIAPKSLEGDKGLEGSNAEYLGRHKQNYVYAVIPEATEAVWPTAGADIRKALDL